MPLFGKKHLQKEVAPVETGKVAKADKKSEKALKAAAPKAAPKKEAPKAEKALAAVSKSSVILRPRITEKASLLSEKGIYVFDIATSANVHTVAAAIKAAYKVTPVKVSVAKIPSKSMFVRGKRGTVSGGKKAYIFLKKGDKIEIA